MKRIASPSPSFSNFHSVRNAIQRSRPKSIEGSAGYLWRDPIYRIYRIYRVAVWERTTKAIN